jgi:NADH-quinone oxidoreductase subunit N
MSRSGYVSAIFYALAYHLVMNFTCFLVIVKVTHDGSDLKIAQLAGLHFRSPLLAMALILSIFSLGGIPPTIGFTGKFLVFTATMQKGYFYLVLIGMINVAISLYYYILVVKAAYVLEPNEELPRIPLSVPVILLTWGMIIVIVVGASFRSISMHRPERRHSYYCEDGLSLLSSQTGLGARPLTRQIFMSKEWPFSAKLSRMHS